MPTKHTRSILVCLAALWVAGLSCNSPQTQTTPDLAASLARTQTALALADFLTQTTLPQATLPSLVVTPTTASPSATPMATSTESQPSPTPTIAITQPPNCTNKARFEGETIPDDTPFNPGEAFTKAWTLRNVGTCTWTPDYALVFDSGDRMGGASPVPVGKIVPPDSTIDVQATLAAPQQPGIYQGFWKLAASQGTVFGLGKNAELPFWVQVVVTGSGSVGSENLGAPTWVETFESNSSYFYLGSDSDVSFKIEDGKLVMTAFTASGDQWRVAERGYIQDFFIEGQFRTGGACSGEDSYGMIVRAPDQADNFIDSGYIFVFSCAGKFRVYRMDNAAFTGLITWTASTSIQAGPDKTNTLGIKVVGDQFELYANSKLIASFTDTTYNQGYFGLTVRTVNTSNFLVQVNEIMYWEIK